MNAFTSSDHTTYPFATTNKQDFNNLLSVYLDATLHPLLRLNDFAQEGWRIGPVDPLASVSTNIQDISANKIVFKGVVYNEMKGQMSDASYLFYVRFQDHLFPEINNSGGDPQKITDLTYDQLKKFHADHYHPSNAKIFTYGNTPLAEHLERIGERLSRFEKISIDSDIKVPINLEEGPREIVVEGPLDPLVPADSQFKTSTTWVMSETSDILETFSLGVLSSLLLDGYGSPLYRSLIESGLGHDWSPNTGFDASGRVGTFSVGLNGVKEEDVPKVRQAIVKSFQDANRNGFEKIKVDGIIHQLELALKHKTAHFGMAVMQRLKPGWFNGVDPLDVLAWSETVSNFMKEYEKRGYLESLVQKYLLNDKTLNFTMSPNEAYGQRIADEEKKRLASKVLETTKGFDSEEDAKKFLSKRELELLKMQEEARDQDLSCLPSVHVADIPREKERKDIRSSQLQDIKVQWREAPTNGLTYFRAVNVLRRLPKELRELVPLFSESIMRLGTRSKTIEDLEELIKLKTGGIGVGYHCATSPFDLKNSEEGIVFSGYALDQNIRSMYELLATVIQETDFDSPEAGKKIQQLLQASASGAINAVADAGHSYARRFAESKLTPASLLAEETSGLTQVKLTTNLASRDVSEGFDDVLQKLKAIQKLAVSRSTSLRVALTCGKESSGANEESLQKFLSSISSSGPSLNLTIQNPKLQLHSKEFFPLPYQVYYAGLAIPTVPYTSASGAALQVLAQMLTHKRLHHEIREKGGAYGGGAYFRGLGGLFGFYSYRDPNPLNTIKIINESGTWARDRDWTTQDIEEAKLSVFQSLDAPQSVSEDGMTRFLLGVDEDMQQTRRAQLLDVTIQDVKNAADEFLVRGFENSNLAVLGEEKEWVKKDGWNIQDMGTVKQAMESAGSAEIAT